MVRRKTAEASLVGKTSLRVRFSEVDSMQIVWHGEYVRYFEDGREAFGREFAGLGYMDIHASGYTAPIVELQLQYKKPLRVNDTAVVETRYIATEAAKICFEYTIRSGTDGEIVEAEFAVDLIRTLTDWNILWEVTVISEKFYEDRFVVIFDPNIKQVNGDPDKGDTWL